jgi:hypothetical protein
VADPAMATVKTERVANIKMAHKLGEIAPQCPHHQMKMIVHQHVGMKLDLVDGKRTFQLAQKGLPIRVIAVDRFAFVAAAGDVIETAGKLDPQRSGHGGVLSK